jgi:hypothetical protein
MTLSARGGAAFDPRIHDPAFLEEIDLYSELIIVAAASAGALSTAAIDQALGVFDMLVAPDDHGRLTAVAG